MRGANIIETHVQGLRRVFFEVRGTASHEKNDSTLIFVLKKRGCSSKGLNIFWGLDDSANRPATTALPVNENHERYTHGTQQTDQTKLYNGSLNAPRYTRYYS